MLFPREYYHTALSGPLPWACVKVPDADQSGITVVAIRYHKRFCSHSQNICARCLYEAAGFCNRNSHLKTETYRFTHYPATLKIRPRSNLPDMEAAGVLLTLFSRPDKREIRARLTDTRLYRTRVVWIKSPYECCSFFGSHDVCCMKLFSPRLAPTLGITFPAKSK